MAAAVRTGALPPPWATAADRGPGLRRSSGPRAQLLILPLGGLSWHGDTTRLGHAPPRPCINGGCGARSSRCCTHAYRRRGCSAPPCCTPPTSCCRVPPPAPPTTPMPALLDLLRRRRWRRPMATSRGGGGSTRGKRHDEDRPVPARRWLLPCAANAHSCSWCAALRRCCAPMANVRGRTPPAAQPMPRGIAQPTRGGGVR